MLEWVRLRHRANFPVPHLPETLDKKKRNETPSSTDIHQVIFLSHIFLSKSYMTKLDKKMDDKKMTCSIECERNSQA